MDPIYSLEPRSVLPLEYEQRYASAVQRRWLRAGVWLTAIALLLWSGEWLFFEAFPMLAGGSVQHFLALLAGYGVVAELLTLAGAWVLCGFDWSGRRQTTTAGWVLRIVLAAVAGLSILQSVPQLLEMRGTQFGIPSPTFWEVYRIIFWCASTALFVQIWFALRGAEGRSRLLLAISIAAMRLLALAQLLVSVRMASSPSAFLQAHRVLWGGIVLGNSAAFGLTGILLLVVVYALRRPETQNRLE